MQINIRVADLLSLLLGSSLVIVQSPKGLGYSPVWLWTCNQNQLPCGPEEIGHPSPLAERLVCSLTLILAVEPESCPVVLRKPSSGDLPAQSCSTMTQRRLAHISQPGNLTLLDRHTSQLLFYSRSQRGTVLDLVPLTTNRNLSHLHKDLLRTMYLSGPKRWALQSVP